MKSLAAGGNPGEALNLFAELKKTYPQSLAYGDAVPTARKAVIDLERRLAFEIGNLPIKLAERAKTVERTALADQARVKQAMDQQDDRLKQAAEQAKSTGNKFFRISSIDEVGLKQMQKDVADLQKELLKPEYSKLESDASAARIEVQTIVTADVKDTRTALDSLAVRWPQFEGLARLKSKVEAKEAAPDATPEPSPAATDAIGNPAVSSPPSEQSKSLGL
jgi:hypothetical protein